MRIERFEDMDAWKEAGKLVNMVYDISDEGLSSKDFSLEKPNPQRFCFSNVQYQRGFR
jgi:S23 ribosomal protein.